MSASPALRPSPAALRLAALLATAAPLTAHPPAEPAPAPATAKQETVVLDPVEVTGAPLAPAPAYRVASSAATGFRAQPVLDTPFSVAGFSADFMQDIQARSLLDVTRNDPSAAPAGDPLWFDRVSVRGFGLSVNAVFRDGLGINDQGSIALDNKEAIEITKGLSSTRQGITSPGGTLNYVVKRPLDQPLTRLTTFGDGFGGFGASADFSRRFGANERFGARVNVAAEEIRSFVDEVEGDRTFASLAFNWRATERLDLDFEVERQDKEISSARGPSLGSFPGSSATAAQAMLPRLGPKIRVTQPWAVEPNTQTYVSGRASYEISDAWRVRLAAHRAELVRDQLGLSATNIQPNGDYDIRYFFSPDQERNNTALVAVVEGDVETGAILHELAFGYDYVRRDMVFGDTSTITIGTGNLFNDVVLPRPNVNAGPAYLASRSNQHALFLTNTAKFGDWLQLFGGARLTRLQAIDGDSAGVLTEAYDKDAFTPSLGLVVKPLPTLSLYASYAEGIEQGGTAPTTANGLPVTNAGQVFDPLTSEQIEIGAKWELPAGALLTLAAFQIDKGLQFVDPATNTYVQNGRQVHRGLEASVSGRVGERLRLVAGAAWLDAEIQRTNNAALLGKRPQGVPEWQANLYADYDLSDLLRGLSINAGLYHTGDKAVDGPNTFFVDSFTRLDLGLRYRHRIGESTTAVWRLGVENVTDERYVNDTSFGALVFGSPTAVRLSATFDF